MSEKVRLGGLWKNTDKNGNQYLSGSLGFSKVMIFQNTRKQDGDKSPDFYLDLFAKDPPGKTGGGDSSIGGQSDADDTPF